MISKSKTLKWIESEIEKIENKIDTERGHVCNLKVSSVMQDYMIELLRKTKNFKQNVIHLKDTQSSG